MHMMEPLKEKLEEFVREGVLERPLESVHARGVGTQRGPHQEEVE